MNDQQGKPTVIQVVQDGKVYYAKEYLKHCMYDGLSFVTDITKAQQYSSIYEFLVALKCLRLTSGYDWDRGFYRLKNIENFTTIDLNTLEKKVYNISEIVNAIEVDLDWYISKEKFKLLEACFYGSSHFMNNDGTIRYYKRGLTSGISSVFKSRHTSIPGCYSFFESRRFMCKDENFLKLYLNTKIGECDQQITIHLKTKKCHNNKE